MTDHIIKAADECGIPISKTFGPMIGACPVGDVLERFYAIAYRQGMEMAAEICEAEQDRSEEARADARFRAALKDGDERNAVDRGTHWMAVHTTNAVLRNAAKAIRALMKETS